VLPESQQDLLGREIHEPNPNIMRALAVQLRQASSVARLLEGEEEQSGRRRVEAPSTGGSPSTQSPSRVCVPSEAPYFPCCGQNLSAASGSRVPPPDDLAHDQLYRLWCAQRPRPTTRQVHSWWREGPSPAKRDVLEGFRREKLV
jgi:hypothetical protein